jgi:hypothetical protein
MKNFINRLTLFTTGNKFFYLIIVLSSLLLSYIWFAKGHVMGTGESGLPFYNLQLNLEAFKDAWNPLNLGSENNIIVASSLTLWFLSRLQHLGFPEFLIQAFFFFTLFSVAGIAVYKLISELIPNIDKRLYLLGSFYYWFNPISLVNIWSRFLNNYFVFWAVLPLIGTSMKRHKKE